MRFRILRAASEIGGNCIEVESCGKSVLLDLGLPIGALRAEPSLLPPVQGLLDGSNADLLGIVVSHPHQDHYGLLECAHESIPVYLGEEALRLLEAASCFTPTAKLRQPKVPYRAGQKIQLGPFSVTPFLVDHSAYDAYALLVEADGKRLLYSGDFRAHGRKSDLMRSLFENPPRNVDVMLMEGTNIGRLDAAPPQAESDLEESLSECLRQSSGLVLACFSAQNIDRLVTFYRASRKSGRTMIVDAYTACILDGIGRKSLPCPRSGDLRIFLPKNQKRRIIRTKRFDLVRPYRVNRIYNEEIAADPKQWVMLFRQSMIEDVEVIGALSGATVIYSLWSGYLDRDNVDLRRWAADHGADFQVQHTSGHAHVNDLRRFVTSISPGRLVPIHTVRPDAYNALFGPIVSAVGDGVWCGV